MLPYKFVNANAGTIAVTGTATSLKSLLDTAAVAANNLPAAVNGVDLVVEDGSVRVAYGNDPSSTKGLLLQQGKLYSFRSIDFDSFKLIRTGSTNVSVSVFVGQSALNEMTTVFGGGNTLGDNTDLIFGAGSDAKFRWDTTDANANMLKLGLPSGGAVDVPVFAIGIASAIIGVDNAVLNGTTQPTLALFDSTATRFISLGWDGTFFRFDTGAVGQQFYFNRAVSFASSLVVGNNAGFQIGTGVGEFFFLNDGTIMRAYGTNRPLYIGQTGAPDKLTLSGNDLFVAGELEVDGTAFFDGGVNMTQGTDIASASTIVIPTNGNTFELTGTTAVNLITTTGYSNGKEIILIANENVTINHGTATSGSDVTILLSGSGNFAMTANDTLRLVLSSTTAGGQAWREISRTVI